MNEPIFSVLSGKYPNGFVATGMGIGDGLTYNTYNYCGAGSDSKPKWCDNDFGDYSFVYLTDWPCGDSEELVSGWFFWTMGPELFYPGGGSLDSPPTGPYYYWSQYAFGACGQNPGNPITLTFTAM
jgi:hypothetical protein